MANSLTGDFDVVAEFSLPAVDRVLAALHQCERLLHSVSLSVDDNPPPGSRLPRPVLVGAVDSFGDPMANHRQFGGFTVFGGGAATAPGARFGGIVNPNLGGFTQGAVEPSHIQGRAQVQIFPPTVDIPDASGTNLSLTMNVMARYFPDPDTSALAEFIRGDLQITAPVTQITAEVANTVEFDIKADVSVTFVPFFSSKPLSPEDLAGINLLVKNALKTSFLPSNATLPSNVSLVQFKTLLGSQKAGAVMLNLSSHPSTWASVTNVFLNPGDDFAFAAGRDFLLAFLQAIADEILSQDLSGSHITLKSASFALQPGKIVLTIRGHASTPVGDTDFTATLEFSLQAVGPFIKLIPGGVSLGDLSNPIVAVANWITGDGTQAVRSARDQALSAPDPNDPNHRNAFDKVTDTFDINQNLGKFLNSLLKPTDTSEPPPMQSIVMSYSGVDIQQDGIVTHGSAWLLFQLPEPHVEFEQIPTNTGGNRVTGGLIGFLGHGPDYSALKTWIPGGRIDQYEWSTQVKNQLYPFGVDPNKFVLLHSGPAVTEGNDGGSLNPFTSLCLTVRGTRLSSQGPVAPQAVSGSVCGYTHVPVIALGLVVQTGGLAAAPTLALTRPDPSGKVVVSGHVSAPVGGPSAPTPNLIVHFSDAKSAAELKHVTRALSQSKKSSHATLVVAILPSGQLTSAPYVDGVVYADDRDGVWERLFGLQRVVRPLTLIADPEGKVTWKHQGALKHDVLADALAKHLVRTENVPISLAGLQVRIGHPAPDFFFEYAPGRQLPLSKVSGRPVALIFWRSSSEPSIQAVLDIQKSATQGPAKTLLLAINDGESSETARTVAAESGFSAALVTDPNRQISLAYGVGIWPTVVQLDAAGVVSGIHYGYRAGEHGGTLTQKNVAAQ